MRWSSPIPRATTVTSAPVASQTLAISLMKLILVARKALRGVLDHLGRGDVGRQHRAVDASVEPGHSLGHARLVRSDDDTVGVHEVLDSRSFSEELRIGGIVDVMVPALGQLGLDRRPGAHRDGRFRHQYAFGRIGGQTVESLPDAGKVGIS